MGRTKENPRYNVISMRISEEELSHLEKLMEKSHMSVSHIMREAFEWFAANHDTYKTKPHGYVAKKFSSKQSQ